MEWCEFMVNKKNRDGFVEVGRSYKQVKRCMMWSKPMRPVGNFVCRFPNIRSSGVLVGIHHFQVFKGFLEVGLLPFSGV